MRYLVILMVCDKLNLMPRLATDTILHHPWQSVLVRIASVIIRSSTCVVHQYPTTEIVISGVIRGI